MSASTQRGLSRRKALWATGFAIAAGLLVFLLGRAFVVAREAARFNQCTNNLKQIGLALHNYHDAFGCLPPAVTYGPDGKPWHSWRVLIVPQLEASSFWSRYRLDEPWNSPHNRALADAYGAPVYRCPSGKHDSRHSSYVAVTGDGTMWPDDGMRAFDDVPYRLNDKIMLVEVAGADIYWTEPRDLTFDELSFIINGEGKEIGSRHREPSLFLPGQPRVNVLFVDGTVKSIPADTPPDELRAMLLIDGNQGDQAE